MPQGRGGNAALQELNWVLSGIIFSLSDLVPGSILSEPGHDGQMLSVARTIPGRRMRRARERRARVFIRGFAACAHAGDDVAAPRGRRISAGQLFAVSTERARAREQAGRRQIPYSAPSVSRRRRAARSGQDRPRGATTIVVCVSENIISPSHKPFRIKAAKSRPVRSGPPPRSDDVSRLREREHNLPLAQTFPYQGGEEPPGPVRTAPAERRR